MVEAFLRLSALTQGKVKVAMLTIALCATLEAGQAQTMICPAEVFVSTDPVTCEAVISSSMPGVLGADVVVLRNIPSFVLTGNGTSTATIDVDALYAATALPFDVVLADFIDGTVDFPNNACSTRVHLVIAVGSAMYCTCPDANPSEFPTPPADADNDLVCDTSDNCPTDSNAQQLDSDGDGTGDVCDPTPGPTPYLTIDATPAEGSFILKSQNGLCWQISMADDGSLEKKQTKCN